MEWRRILVWFLMPLLCHSFLLSPIPLRRFMQTSAAASAALAAEHSNFGATPRPKPKPTLPAFVVAKSDIRALIEIIYEDEHIIALNKPPNLLSVAGKLSRIPSDALLESCFPSSGSKRAFDDSGSAGGRGGEEAEEECDEDCEAPAPSAKQSTGPSEGADGAEVLFIGRRRHEEWLKNVRACAEHVNKLKRDGDESIFNETCVLLTKLAEMESLPRQAAKFKRFLTRHFRILDTAIIDQIWNLIERMDFKLSKSMYNQQHGQYVECMTDILEEFCGHRIFSVHRLDQETSGLIIYSKTAEASAGMCEQFRSKEVQKTYLAQVIGDVPDSITEIDVAIRPDLDNRPYSIVDNLNGKPSKTLVKVLERSTIRLFRRSMQYNDKLSFLDRKKLQEEEEDDEEGKGKGETKEEVEETSSSSSEIDPLETNLINENVITTLVELKPITGRTHQLRLHLSHIGHPILGDTLYAPRHIMNISPRLCLHAFSISFKHPISQENITISTPRVNVFRYNEKIYKSQ